MFKVMQKSNEKRITLALSLQKDSSVHSYWRYPYKRIPPSTHIGVILTKGFLLPLIWALSFQKDSSQNRKRCLCWREMFRMTQKFSGKPLILEFSLYKDSSSLVEIANGLGDMKSNLYGWYFDKDVPRWLGSQLRSWLVVAHFVWVLSW